MSKHEGAGAELGKIYYYFGEISNLEIKLYSADC